MKTIIKSLIVLVFFSSLTQSQIRLAKEIKDMEPEIKSYLEKKIIEENNNTKTKIYFIDILRGDINEDGRDDAYVSYTIQGFKGTYYNIMYQTLFIYDNGKLIFKAELENHSIDTRQQKLFHPLKIENGRITGKTMTDDPDDGTDSHRIIMQDGEILFKNGELIENYASQ